MSKKITEVAGIGLKYAMLLDGEGIKTATDLLEIDGDKKGRMTIATNTAINEKLILRWVNMCDLFRVKVVGGQCRLLKPSFPSL